MGLFDIFKRKKANADAVKENDITHEKQAENDCLMEFARRLSDNDRLVLLDLRNYYANPEEWLTDHRPQMAERGAESGISRLTPWLILADGLVEQGYACELDWNCDADTFVWSLNLLFGVKSNALPVRTQWMDPEEAVPQWCRILEEKWAAQGFCLASLDIGGDSYVMLPVKTSEMEELSLLAQNGGCRFVRVSET